MCIESVRRAFEPILLSHSIAPTSLDWARIRTTEKTITEAPDGESPLSGAIINRCFPESLDSDFVHYTNFRAFENIAHSRTWRLACLDKRLKEHEYTTFCADHGLVGSFVSDPHTGEPYFKEVIKDLFYTSLTLPGKGDEKVLWEDFGEKGSGVRLHLRVRPVRNRAELRSIRYQDASSRTLIQELTAAANHLKRRLVLRGISKIAAFYLPPDYAQEAETRLLIKRSEAAEWGKVTDDGGVQFLPLVLNEPNELCRIDLTKVEPGIACDAAAVRGLLDQSGFRDVPS